MSDSPIIKDSDIPNDLIPQLRENANYVVYTKEEVDLIRNRVYAIFRKLKEKNQLILNFNLGLQKKNVEFEFQIQELTKTATDSVKQAEQYKKKCAELEAKLNVKDLW